MDQRRVRDRGIVVGSMPCGTYNRITDVPGVRVGHCTVDTERHKTGVTVILPAPGNLFREKVVGAVHVINGYGKSAGLMQIAELGTIEAPIALTGTLNVGLVTDAMIAAVQAQCQSDGTGAIPSVNIPVGETNDGTLNDFSERVVGQSEVFAALRDAQGSPAFALGDVGAGKGTICFGLKGGIGSASRQMEIGGRTFTLGVLVQTNFGATPDLTVCGDPVGQRLWKRFQGKESDQGSVMIAVGCDLPVDARQLTRILHRAVVGLARTGSFVGHGSGDVVIGFSTANRIREGEIFRQTECLAEEVLEPAFRAVAECVEESILDSLFCAGGVTGYTGVYVPPLSAFYPD